MDEHALAQHSLEHAAASDEEERQAPSGEHDVAHGAEHHAAPPASGALPEVPNWVTVVNHLQPQSSAAHFLHRWENVVFSWTIAFALGVVFVLATRRLTAVPGRVQGFLEMIAEGLEGLVTGILGQDGRHYTPFIATLFLYILSMNLAGLVPGMKSPTANLNTTLGLAVVVFLYVQYTGIRRLGLVSYLKHFAGEPWFLAPLNFVLHVVGEFIKPVSLALRLFANLTGEDLTMYYLIGLGIMCLGGARALTGLPLQVLFYPLVLLFSLIQALVFSLLSTVYISLMLPHEEHAGGHH